MATPDEINYIANVSKVLNVPLEQFENYLIGKPFSDQRRGWYLMDITQILQTPSPAAGTSFRYRGRFRMEVENLCTVRL
jgi:hypothetical protein